MADANHSRQKVYLVLILQNNNKTLTVEKEKTVL